MRVWLLGDNVDTDVITPGNSVCTTWLNFFRNSTASMFSRPPYSFGIHSPCLRE